MDAMMKFSALHRELAARTHDRTIKTVTINGVWSNGVRHNNRFC